MQEKTYSGFRPWRSPEESLEVEVKQESYTYSFVFSSHPFSPPESYIPFPGLGLNNEPQDCRGRCGLCFLIVLEKPCELSYCFSAMNFEKMMHSRMPNTGLSMKGII